MLFYYLAPLQNDCIMMSQFMQFNFGDKREVYLLDESVLPLTKKERRREGKKCISPWMKFMLHLLFVCGQNDLRFACPYFILGLMLMVKS